MLPIKLPTIGTILCLGAHSDDLEIGCGGTLLQLLAQQRGISVHWVIFSAAGERGREARASAEELLQSAAARKIELLEFRDTCFPFVGMEIKESFIQLQRDVRPDLIFTHRRDDAHQDHRLIAELTWNAFRDHMILEYEIPKYDGDLRTPSVYVPLAAETARQKVDHLQRHFGSQRQKPWFTAETFQAVLRLRGIECNSLSGLAEGFDCRKLALG